MQKRGLALLLMLVLLSALIVPGTVQAEEYENTYVNTGDQRKDIIGVALTQLGYKEGANNASKYGSWMGVADSPWCASFVSWCAAQADISEDVLRRTVWVAAGSDSFDIKIYYNTKNYTPQPGDLFYKNDFSHVGLVLRVEGDSFYTIEGNSDVLGSQEGLYVISNKRLLADCYFGVPEYKGAGDHEYIKKTEVAHPHRNYYECKTCNDTYYTGSNEYNVACDSCKSCNCATDYAGYYICDEDISVLNVRAGHGVAYKKIGGVHPGAIVYVYASDGNWAHIRYDNLYGYVSQQYLTPYTLDPPPSEPTEPSEPTQPESEPTVGPTAPPHEHAYGKEHYHTCECGEIYSPDAQNCPLCGTTGQKPTRQFPWWILCILEALVIGSLLMYIRERKKKKRKVKYMHK